MKILAIEKELKNTDWSKQIKNLEEEARVVYNLQLKGFVREIYFIQNKNAVLILECEDLSKAGELLKTLPLVKEGLIEFDILELKPYTGYDRIIKKL